MKIPVCALSNNRVYAIISYINSTPTRKDQSIRYHSPYSAQPQSQNTNMPIDLYGFAGSSQCHAIQMVAAAIGVELNVINVNLAAGEHRKPEFLAINPQHTIPTLHDNGFALWETRAIIVYLVEKYGPANSQLYPADNVERRARINQRLYFDMGTLYKAFGDAYYSLFLDVPAATPEQLQKVVDAFDFLNTFLEGEQFVAGGTQLSVADIALYATVAIFVRLAKYDLSKHANVDAWFKRQRSTIPGVQISIDGLEILAEYAEKNRQAQAGKAKQ